MKLLVLFALMVASALANPIEPSFDAYRDTRLLLSTRQNRGNPFQLLFRNEANLNSSPFNPNRPTRFLIHGWWEDDTSDISVGTSEELLNYYDFNVIFVDWSEGSRTINYPGAASRTDPVGHFTGSYINWLVEIGRLDWDRVKVIGFSLGAHIAGFTGKTTNGRLHTIVGLDPAGPLFAERNPEGRLDRWDARYVECLHTNSAILGLGIPSPICEANWYPNGGEDQRGCLTNTCSHLRAVQYYIESIQNNGFHSTRCESERQANRENCGSEGGFWPTGELSNPSNMERRLSGFFHYRTNRNPPFAQGPFRN